MRSNVSSRDIGHGRTGSAQSSVFRHVVKSLFLGTSLALGLLLIVSGSAWSAARDSAAAQARNPIQRENARPGSRSWSLDSTARHGEIVGYASEVSVFPGQVVHFHVSTTPSADYQIVLYRLGWYRGSGGRQFACIPACRSGRKGTPQRVPPPDPKTGLVQGGWPVTDTYRFPRRAVSGYFLAKLRLISGKNDGKVAYIPLILRAPPSSRSTILVQASVNTWQAYNAWGGKSLYAFNSTYRVPANHVSFDRPYDPKQAVPITHEIGLVRFLERRGYNVSYTTDVDTDRERRGAQTPSPCDLVGPRRVLDEGNARRFRSDA